MISIEGLSQVFGTHAWHASGIVLAYAVFFVVVSVFRTRG
jgi:hypothetical protein